MSFVKEYNARTSDKSGSIVPVHISVFEDRSFSFVTRTPPASDLLRRAASVEKGVSESREGPVGAIDRRALREIAEAKMADLNASSIEQAMSIIEGTARSMGIRVAQE